MSIPSPGFGAGHSAQYTTLAEALRLNVETMEAEIADLAIRGFAPSAASLRMEARFVTVTLLAAALCESVANVILATVCSATAFEKLDRLRTVEKWTVEIPRHLGGPSPSVELQQELELLFRVRNSIMHAKATIYSEGETIANPGNTEQWQHLAPGAARKFAALPLALVTIIPADADLLVHAVGISLLQRQPRPPLYLVPGS